MKRNENIKINFFTSQGTNSGRIGGCSPHRLCSWVGLGEESISLAMSFSTEWCSEEKLIEWDPPEVTSLFHNSYNFYCIVHWPTWAEHKLAWRGSTVHLSVSYPVICKWYYQHIITYWVGWGLCKGEETPSQRTYLSESSFVSTSLFLPSSVWSLWKDCYQLSLTSHLSPWQPLSSCTRLLGLLVSTLHPALNKPLQIVAIWYTELVKCQERSCILGSLQSAVWEDAREFTGSETRKVGGRLTFLS